MADVINLRTARKRKERSEKEQRAAENRALHGRPKVEKKQTRLEAEKSASFIEAHRLEPVDRGKP